MIDLAVAAVASLSAVVLGSLLLADRVLARDGEGDLPPPTLYPLPASRDPRCPICTAARWEGTSLDRLGPAPPVACRARRCPARGRAHLHVRCRSCRSRYLVAAAPAPAP